MANITPVIDYTYTIHPVCMDMSCENCSQGDQATHYIRFDGHPHRNLPTTLFICARCASELDPCQIVGANCHG